MSQQPKECPFCGSTNLETKRNNWVQCQCGTYGPNPKEGETAIDAWNRRTGDDDEAL